jgi:hypothetical protein
VPDLFDVTREAVVRVDVRRADDEGQLYAVNVAIVLEVELFLLD